MNQAQASDYAFQANRLLLLVARRDELPEGSDQISILDAELISIEALLRSYQLETRATLTTFT